MLWGHHGLGTKAAVYYISENYNRLSALKKESYFCVIKVRRQEGYKRTLEPLVDISSKAFDTTLNELSGTPAEL